MACCHSPPANQIIVTQELALIYGRCHPSRFVCSGATRATAKSQADDCRSGMLDVLWTFYGGCNGHCSDLLSTLGLQDDL